MKQNTHIWNQHVHFLKNFDRKLYCLQIFFYVLFWRVGAPGPQNWNSWLEHCVIILTCELGQQNVQPIKRPRWKFILKAKWGVYPKGIFLKS